ncbi:MAG: hypothetical protein ACE5QV_08815 [Fidelibacterota bacterium]|jgi:hypothetical protein
MKDNITADIIRKVPRIPKLLKLLTEVISTNATKKADIIIITARRVIYISQNLNKYQYLKNECQQISAGKNY